MLGCQTPRHHVQGLPDEGGARGLGVDGGKPERTHVETPSGQLPEGRHIAGRTAAETKILPHHDHPRGKWDDEAFDELGWAHGSHFLVETHHAHLVRAGLFEQVDPGRQVAQ